jgi:hypothetical protein
MRSGLGMAAADGEAACVHRIRLLAKPCQEVLGKNNSDPRLPI